MKNEKVIAIVLAGGRGKRMGAAVSKQYLLINDKPVLYYTLKAFEDSNIDEIILVTEKNNEEYCRENIIERYNIKKVKHIVCGGKERYNSVYNGLKCIDIEDNNSYIMIHDGARALITSEIINNTIEKVKLYKAVVVGVPVKDTIKKTDAEGFVTDTPARDTLWQIQTPQAFVVEEIKRAYEKVIGDNVEGITDDSMVMEYSGIRNVKVIMGSYENIKITTPEDLIYANAVLK